MTRVELPAPRIRRTGSVHTPDGLVRELRRRVDGEVRIDAGRRAAYSGDASNFRVVPLAVVTPRTPDAAADALTVCHEFGVAVLPRGGGTSLAGQGVNEAVVIDFSRHCTGLISVDAEARTCWVEPGIVLDDLNVLLRPYGLRFGPQPSTHNRCTIGGMIGNNACGATAQQTGKTADNTLALDVMLYDGTRLRLGRGNESITVLPRDRSSSERDSDPTDEAGAERLRDALTSIRDEYGDDVRREFPAIPRRVSGYNLDCLLDEQDVNLAASVVGSEGGLALVLMAQLRLMPVVPHTALVLLGYDDVAASADDVPAILEHEPLALEGFDARIMEYKARSGKRQDARALLPADSAAWLFVRFGGADDEEVSRATDAFRDAAAHFDAAPVVTVFTDTAEQQAVWSLREGALGASSRVPGMPPMWSGWEDAAVPPERLGPYLRDFTALLAEFGYEAAPLYGHYGQGCVHTRIPFDFETDAGVADYRRFLTRAAETVVRHGGSLSGEHGDGRSRSELLELMYGPRVREAFVAFKRAFDPAGRMNPGMIAHPAPLDAWLRSGADRHPSPVATHFAFSVDGGDFSHAVSRCVGVGVCRRGDSGVMCPSYMVTGEEEHSTRGRSRILAEMMEGRSDSPINEGWRSKDVRDALDLCLSCKGCVSDCPVSVDMATYKAEFLSHHYAGRLRPLAHYSMGWLPALARIGRRIPRLVNALTQTPGVRRVVKAAGGIATQRDIPAFAEENFTRWYGRRGPRGSGERGRVVLWPDTFSNSFHPQVARAAVEVLEDAGWHVVVPEADVCCGLTWISTGQLGIAERVLRRTADVLAPYLDEGLMVVGLEPSCTAVFRADAAELLAEDSRIRLLKERTVTLSELLVEHSPGWQVPRADAHVLMQQHCHQHAVIGSDPDLELLKRAGALVELLDSGCCGLAGNFGFESGHYDVSQACGERVLYPALRNAADEDVILADGFSCRTQIEQGDTAGRRGMHLAELLAAGLRARDRAVG